MAFAATTPTATPVQRATAIAKPSVVFIKTIWHGYVINGPLAFLLSPDGESAPAFTVATTCSGFIANPKGYVVTAGHCVDDQSAQFGGKGLIIKAAIVKAIQEGYYTPSEATGLLKEGYANWRVEGTEKGSPPDRTVGVFPTKAASSIVVSSPIVANVVDFRSFTKGDVALLKVESHTDMPAVQVASDTPAGGTPIVAAGFAGSVTDTVDPNTTEPSFKDGTISSNQRTIAGVPFTEIGAATSAGMSGGPVFDMDGRVVGTVSWTPGEETQSFNFMTAASAVHELLASHAVSNALSVTDKTYRDGLTLFYAGKYHAAVKKFDQVLAVEPDHAQAQDFRRQSVTNYPNEKSGGSNMMLIVGIVVAVVVLLGGGAALFFLRRRHRTPKAPATLVGAPAWTPPAPPASESPAPAAPSTEVVPAEAAPEARVEHAADTHGTGGFCPNCGEPHPAEAHFCAACGQPFPIVAEHGGTTRS